MSLVDCFKRICTNLHLWKNLQINDWISYCIITHSFNRAKWAFSNSILNHCTFRQSENPFFDSVSYPSSLDRVCTVQK